jgi:hypothetical protein
MGVSLSTAMSPTTKRTTPLNPEIKPRKYERLSIWGLEPRSWVLLIALGKFGISRKKCVHLDNKML